MTLGNPHFSAPAVPSPFGVCQPIEYGSVTLPGGQWETWRQRNRATTIPHGLRMIERYGNLENFRRISDSSDAPWRGQLFADSDVYKMLEAVAWELGRNEDADLRQFFDSTVALLSRAQQADGYLDSAYQAQPERAPWSDFEHGHELYCLGHLIQAAVAAKRALNDDALLGVACRFADHVVERFGGSGRTEYCGHPLVEMALIELSRVTEERRYIDLAEEFVRRRGSGFIGDARFGAAYYQDDSPVATTNIMRGHAVRALYLNEGATDLYRERGDATLLDAMVRQWADMVAHRIYITGGTGSRHQDEAFGTAYELPADRAYSETCAGIALFRWAWRMYLATGEAHYLDTGEVALYNVVLAGISAEGESFTYSNPLQRRPNHLASREEEASKRLPWFECACCPPNLMRTFASLEQYVVAMRDRTLEVAHFADADVALGDYRVEVRAAFPEHGRISVQAHGEVPPEFRIALRVPAWAELSAAEVLIDGEGVIVPVKHGWLRPDVPLSAGSVIEVELPIRPTIHYPHRRADALRGTLAVSRGPVVYCADQADNECDIDLVEIDDHHVEETSVALAGGPALRMQGLVAPERSDAVLYSTAKPATAEHPVELTLRPYASWGAQESGAMRVWLPRQF